MRELFHPHIMTSLIWATPYHKNAMNKLISGIIARCDITQQPRYITQQRSASSRNQLGGKQRRISNCRSPNCLVLMFLYPIFEAAFRIKAESAIVCRFPIAIDQRKSIGCNPNHTHAWIVSLHSLLVKHTRTHTHTE